MAVDDSLLHRLHQPLVRDRLEARGDVRLDHPAPAPEALIEDELQGIVRRPLRPEAKGAALEVGLEDRLHDRLRGRLHDPGRAQSGSRAAAAPWSRASG